MSMRCRRGNDFRNALDANLELGKGNTISSLNQYDWVRILNYNKLSDIEAPANHSASYHNPVAPKGLMILGVRTGANVKECDSIYECNLSISQTNGSRSRLKLRLYFCHRIAPSSGSKSQK